MYIYLAQAKKGRIMGEPLKNLLIMLGAIVVILLLVILLFRGKSPVMKFLNLFFEEDENFPKQHSQTASYRSSAVSASNQSAQPQQMSYDQPDQPQYTEPQYTAPKKTGEPIVEMATLIRKSDDRLRIIERDGSQRLIDAYYELIFETRKGQHLKITCSPEAYEKIPFDEQGSLTYKRGVLVKFKMYDRTIYNNE